MEIVALQIKNFMSLKDVELKMGQINQIVGQNSQGKTSILKAIETAVKGSGDGKLVTFGEERAEIILELDDQIIRRIIKSDGKQTVTVRKGEFDVRSPQTYLETLFDFSAFNPLELLEPKRRAEAIMKAIEITVDAESISERLGVAKEALPPIEFKQHGLKVIDDLFKYYYSRRAEANRATAEKKTRFETYKKDLTEVKPLSMTREQIEAERAVLNARQSAADGQLMLVAKDMDLYKANAESLKKYCEAYAQIEKDIVAANLELAKLEERKKQGQIYIENMQNKIGIEPDIAPVTAEVESIKLARQSLKTVETEIEAHEAISKQQEMIGNMEKEYLATKATSDKYDEMLIKLGDGFKKELMSKVEMPIAGLEYKDGVFLVDGTPVDNLSSSTALKLAVAVARKLSKKTKIINIDGAEALDEETYKAFIAEIKDDGYTYFISKVGDGVEGVNTIKMSKGEVVQ